MNSDSFRKILNVECGSVCNKSKIQHWFSPVISLSVLLRAEVNLGGEVGPVGHDEVSALGDDRLHAHLPQHARDKVPLGRQVYNHITRGELTCQTDTNRKAKYPWYHA
jgi:hypothetical protein